MFHSYFIHPWVESVPPVQLASPSLAACLFIFLFVFFPCVIYWVKMSYIGERLHNSWPAFPTTLPYFVERMKSCCWREEVGKQGASISHTTKIELLGAWCPCLHSDGSAVLLACVCVCVSEWVCVFDRNEGLLQSSLLSRCTHLTLIDAHCTSYCDLSMLSLKYDVIVSLKSHKYDIRTSF